MKLSVLVGKKRILLTVCAFIFSSILLAGCGRGGSTIESTEATTNVGATTESSIATQETEEGVGSATPPAPTPPMPPSPPIPPVAQEVNCGIGAFNALNCTNAADEQFSCSGDSHAMGSPYGCMNTSSGSQFNCVIVASRMGGFTLSCAGLPQ